MDTLKIKITREKKTIMSEELMTLVSAHSYFSFTFTYTFPFIFYACEVFLRSICSGNKKKKTNGIYGNSSVKFCSVGSFARFFLGAIKNAHYVAFGLRERRENKN